MIVSQCLFEVQSLLRPVARRPIGCEMEVLASGPSAARVRRRSGVSGLTRCAGDFRAGFQSNSVCVALLRRVPLDRPEIRRGSPVRERREVAHDLECGRIRTFSRGGVAAEGAGRVGKGAAIIDSSEERGCFNDSDTGAGRRPARLRILACQRREFIVINLDPSVEV